MKRIGQILERNGLNSNHNSFVSDLEKRKDILRDLKDLYNEPKYAKHNFWRATRDFAEAMANDSRNPKMHDLKSFIINEL